jgi:hypothetical protein
MQDGSVTFYPVRLPPLELWQIVLGVILFLVLIAAIIWRLRSHPEKNPGSFNLDGH